MKGTTIFSDLLSELGVPHVGRYSDSAFRNMPFQSLFGFSRLLKSYGIDSEGLRLASASDITSVPAPYLAQTSDGFVIVTGTDSKSVNYVHYHEPKWKPTADFEKDFTGIVLIPYATKNSAEPDYSSHLRSEIFESGKKWVLAICLLFLLTAGFILSGTDRHLSLIFLFVTDLAGLAVCRLLMLKARRVKSHTADKMCGILQKHGCDTVLEQKASTFLGIVKWSDVGMAYFSISTLVLLAFPEACGWLALANACCLPFTVWSISYQKFKIKAWCTMCVTVQGLLWLQFLCFLFGGWWKYTFPLPIGFFLLLSAYVAMTLILSYYNIDEKTSQQ